MEYTLVQKADKDMVFYGIYFTGTEQQDGSDMLCAVRKEYFESGKKLKNRSSKSIGGALYRSSYTIEDGKPLKWKKMLDSRLAERVAVVNDGYFVESTDEERRPVKRVYFDNMHKLLSVEFYHPGRTEPFCTVTPSTDGSSAVLVKKQKGTACVLYPFEYLLDKALTEKLNIIAGEPQLFCVTSSGGFYFCTESEAKERKKALDHIIENDIDPVIPEDTADIEQSGNGFEVNINALEEKPAEMPEPAPAADVKPAPEENKVIEKAPAEKKNVILKKPEEGAQVVNEPVREQPSAVSARIPPLDEKKFGDAEQEQSLCGFMKECPYEGTEKLIIESGGRQYYYFGDTDGDRRSGNGRTAMSDGRTAYEGSYRDDKRDGFGVYYFKSGKLCYAGNWKQNKRSGAGAAFSPSDGGIYVGKWEDNYTEGLGASFDREGRLVYLGKTSDGKRCGAGITYSYERDTFFIGKYKDGEFTGEGTQFDSEGNMLYVGGYSNNMRIGSGTSYKPDGTVIYTGQWKNNLYHGEGTLYLEDGCILRGSFREGKACGQCTLSDSLGRPIYTGSFSDDTYNGTGRIFTESGGYAEGRFVGGEPTGVFNEYDRDKQLIYCGEWTDMHRNGKGIEYRDGKKVYDGDFRDDIYHGTGKLFEDGSLVYAGGFENGIRCGVGTQYENEEIVFFGQWENNDYNGCGILYSGGQPIYIGCFRDGKRQGRINKIHNGRIRCESVYDDDKCIYTKLYSSDGMITYYGNVHEGKRSGMGCSFNIECEKEFEGIFRDNEPEKPMQVFLAELMSLPECAQLAGTDYEKYRFAPSYAVGLDIGGGTFTGQLRDGRPNGKGTILYRDHRYTGHFSAGSACGSGIIYKPDGSEIRGSFTFAEDNTSKQTIAFNDVSYHLL